MDLFNIKLNLMNLSTELKKYAHNGNIYCVFDYCPGMCSIEHDLNLDTSIAWELADIIDTLFDMPIHNFQCDYHRDKIKNDVEKLSIVVYGFYCVLRNHVRKYSHLFNLIVRVKQETHFLKKIVNHSGSGL